VSLVNARRLQPASHHNSSILTPTVNFITQLSVLEFMTHLEAMPPPESSQRSRGRDNRSRSPSTRNRSYERYRPRSCSRPRRSPSVGVGYTQRDLLRMEPRWPDPPTQLSSGLRESIQLNTELVRVLELASANLAYSYSKVAGGLLKEEDLRSETGIHHELMHCWHQKIAELKSMHIKGHGQIDKALAFLSGVGEEQNGTSEIKTQKNLLGFRLHELFELFKPPRSWDEALDGRQIQQELTINTHTKKSTRGSVSAPIDLTQKAVAGEQVHGKQASNPNPSSSSFLQNAPPDLAPSTSQQ